MTTAVLFLLLLGVRAPARPASRPPACLPENVKMQELVSVTPRGEGGAVERITVAKRLKQLKARCRRGKLVDGRGKEIYFYRLTGCWGYPPPGYVEILERQRKEISDLKKRYVVLEMPCNASGVPVP